ncbi:MAG: DUF983 domain-containing protein [Proteobacteria bacterium]|nr:DUF983 domain-containing protein [Pseudomonadota bacterium]
MSGGRARSLPADPAWAGPPPSLLTVALRGRCPRCGQGKLFLGLLAVRDRCAVCGLDLRGNDAGDGAPVGVMFVLGPILVILAYWMETRFDPPLWVFAVVLVVITPPLAVVLMRPAKAALVGIQYRYRGSEMGH